MKNISILSLLSLAFLFFACAGNHSTESSASEDPNFSGIAAEMEVGGMGCMRCVNKVTNALAGMDGVANIKVSLDDEKATFEYDPEKTNLDEVARLIGDLDYEIGAYGPVATD